VEASVHLLAAPMLMISLWKSALEPCSDEEGRSARPARGARRHALARPRKESAMKRAVKIVLLAAIGSAGRRRLRCRARQAREQKPAAAVAVAEFLQNDLYIVEPGALDVAAAHRLSDAVQRRRR
jgi:hypothetical protein